MFDGHRLSDTYSKAAYLAALIYAPKYTAASDPGHAWLERTLVAIRV